MADYWEQPEHNDLANMISRLSQYHNVKKL